MQTEKATKVFFFHVLSLVGWSEQFQMRLDKTSDIDEVSSEKLKIKVWNKFKDHMWQNGSVAPLEKFNGAAVAVCYNQKIAKSLFWCLSILLADLMMFVISSFFFNQLVQLHTLYSNALHIFNHSQKQKDVQV